MFEKLISFWQMMERIAAAPDTEKKILAILDAAKTLASWTPTHVDDDMVALLKEMMSDSNLRKLLAGVVDKLFAAHESGTASVMSANDLDEHDFNTVQAAGIDFGKILQLAQLLLDVLSKLRR